MVNRNVVIFCFIILVFNYKANVVLIIGLAGIIK